MCITPRERVTDHRGTHSKGGFINGKREGKGKAVSASGDVMQGWFKDDEFAGEGVKTTSGGYVFSGVWERGYLNGKGRELARTLLFIHLACQPPPPPANPAAR